MKTQYFQNNNKKREQLRFHSDISKNFKKLFYDKKNVYKPQNSLIQNLSTNLTCFIIHCCCEHSIYPPTSILNAVTPVIGLSHKYC